MDPYASRTVALTVPLDLRITLAPLAQGRHDPCTRMGADGWWRAMGTPDGPVTLHLRVSGTELEAEAWGAGAPWSIEHAARLVGLEAGRDDDADHFDRLVAPSRRLTDLNRRLPGLRIPCTGAVAEALVPTVLEQKVTGVEAKRSFRRLVLALGEPAPGPPGLVVPPAPAVLSATPSWVFHRAGVERRRAETLTGALARAYRLEEATTRGLADAYRRLLAFPGVGPWTAATVGLMALGDIDAVPLGDYHLPDQVSWALAGEPRGDDDRMLELLEPYRGRRARVLRLLVAGGIRPPRYGPRLSRRSIAAH